MARNIGRNGRRLNREGRRLVCCCGGGEPCALVLKYQTAECDPDDPNVTIENDVLVPQGSPAEVKTTWVSDFTFPNTPDVSDGREIGEVLQRWVLVWTRAADLPTNQFGEPNAFDLFDDVRGAVETDPTVVGMPDYRSTYGRLALDFTFKTFANFIDGPLGSVPPPFATDNAWAGNTSYLDQDYVVLGGLVQSSFADEFAVFKGDEFLLAQGSGPNFISPQIPGPKGLNLPWAWVSRLGGAGRTAAGCRDELTSDCSPEFGGTQRNVWQVSAGQSGGNQVDDLFCVQSGGSEIQANAKLTTWTHAPSGSACNEWWEWDAASKLFVAKQLPLELS